MIKEKYFNNMLKLIKDTRIKQLVLDHKDELMRKEDLFLNIDNIPFLFYTKRSNNVS